jgi:hypothetical protein
MILQVLIAMVAGWLQRHQQQVITYLLEENRVLKAQLGDRRLRLTDTERRRLATLAHPLGRQRLKAVASLATPDTRIVKILKQPLSLGLSDGLSTPASCRPFLLHTINWTPH